MKKTFKYLSYAIIYLLISLASAYGVITLSINNSNRLSSKGDSSKPSPAPSLPTQLTKVVDNFSQSEYIGFNFSADIKTSFDNFCILVEANIDLSQGIEKIKVDGSINAEIESKNQYYNIDFGYQNETAYFDLFNGKLSIDTKNILKPVNQILNLLEIEMPDIVGVLGEMDLDTILGFFSNLKEEADPADPEKLNLLITLPMIEQVMTIVCDKEYKVDALLFNFVSDDINANIKANFTYPENVEIENKNNEEYVKVNSLLDVVTGTINYIKTNENFAFDIALEYDEYDVSGKLYINPEKQEGKISLNIAENIVNLIYIDKTIYIEYENVYFKFNFNEYAKVCDFIENTFGINLPVEDIINLLNNFNKEDLLKLLSDFGLDMSEIEFNDLSILEKVYIENETTFIKLKDIGTISIGIKDEKFSSIGFTGQNTNISLNTTTYKNINLNVDENNYINIVDILPTLQNGIDIFKANSLSGTLLIDYKEYSLPVDLILSLKDGYAKLSTQINSYNLIIEKVNNKVYINFADKMKVIVNLDNFIDEIIEFLSDINYDIDLSEITDSLKDLNNIFAPQSSPLLFKEFTKTENGIEITLFNDMTIKIVNGCKQITISSGFENINFSASIIASDETIEIPNFNDEEYTKVEDVLDLAKVVINSGIIQAVEGSINYFAQKTIALDFNVDYADAVAKGQIFIDIENLRLFLNAEMSGEKFNIALEKNIVYLEYKNIFVKFDIFDTPIVFEMLNREFGLNLPVEFITKLLSAVQSGKIENVVDTIKDEFNIDINLDEVKFDISKIDKTFFENIIVDGNKTIIPYGDKTITLEVTDKMLTKFDFNGLGIDLKTSTIEYKENVLSANKENYINIVDILPTLQNVLDIVKSDSIFGNLNVKSQELEIPVVFKVDKKSDNIYAEFIATVYQGVISIYYDNNKVYINIFDQIKLVSDLEELPSAVEELTDGLDTLINPILDLIGISKKVVDSFEENDNATPLFSSFIKTENGLEMIVNGINIKLTNDLKQLLISANIDTLEFNGSIIGNDEIIERATFGEEYIDIEKIFRLVNSAKNMSKREDFHVKGFVDLKLGTLALDTVEFDIYIKVVDKKIQLIVEFPNIPTIPFVTKGLFENVKDRSTKIYFHDDTIYMLRKETKDNKLHQQTIKLSPNSFTSDIYTYIQFAFGFTDTIMEQIRKPAEKYREGDTINLNNVLRNFAIVEETNNSQTRYDLTLNLAEIADNKVLGDLSLRLYIGENENGESYIQELGMNMAVLGGFVNLATPLQNNQDDKTKTIKIVDYGKNIDDKMQELYDYDSSYTFAYDTMMEKTGDGEWTKMSEVLRTITFETNCDTVLPQISAPFKTEITIPTLETIILDDGVTKTIKTFAGWFSSENFEPESLFTSKTMPQSDVTLFAKWDNEVLKYSTINFVTNSSETLDPITALEGEKISIPTLNNKQVVAEDGKTVSTYRFDGWYLDENTTTRFDNFAMPNVDTLLYAKWTLVSVEHSSLLSIYDNDNLIYSIYLPSGKDIDLSGLSNINENTKFYLDSGYMNVFNGSLIMPEYDLSLHVRNKYTLSIKSEFGNAIESITTFWQGQSFTVPTQEDYYVDDGTRTQRDFYFFRGYSVNGVICDIPSIMPNQNTEIVAVWEKETKFYYTVSFDMRWYKVDGCGPAHKLKVEADPIAPIVLLEGSVLDLSIYQPTCIAQKTLIYNNVTYKATSWGTSAWANGTKGGSGVTSIEITSNTTLYACWQEQ